MTNGYVTSRSPDDVVIGADFKAHRAKNEWLAGPQPLARPDFWRSAALRNRAIDGRVTLGLNTRIWAEVTRAQGRVMCCQLTLKELDVTAIEFRNSAWRIFGSVGIPCTKVDTCQISQDMVEVALPAEIFNANRAALIELWHAVKERQENGAHFR